MDKFVKVKKIGEGSFGKAILVRSKTDGQQYVIKEIGIIKMNAREREDSRKEVAVLAQLNHPNIVTYRESFEEHGSLYIVMDYCAGGDLYSRINTQRGILFSEDQVLDWFVQVSLALKHIHDRKILHRDIKSQNIFLTNSGRVQLGDFGIAKVLNSTVELARTCIGTPYYLSPEMCENKPYNNKSDIWSLGCVLYEVTTLKHAFDSGNMKNLVLKIIRGSYPPVSPKYSYELRNLIAQLFKRAPRDRPSVNTVLRKPFLRPRIQKFLSDSEYADEFSHTIMHGVKLKRALPPPPQGAVGRPPSVGGARPPVVPARTPSAGRGRAGGPPRYDPAAIYGKPVVRRSAENKRSLDLKRRPGSGGRGGPVVPANKSLEKRRQELVEREKKRREEARTKVKQQYEKKHQDLLEKQKAARMNKAKEEGWKNVLNLGSGGSEPDAAKPQAASPRERGKYETPSSAAPNDRGKYEQYHAYLDQLDQKNKGRPKPQPMEYMPAPAKDSVPDGLAWPSSASPRSPSPAAYAAKQAQENRMLAGQAAERAKIVEDFLQRKREAAVNKARGDAEIFGRVKTPAQSQPTGAGQKRPVSARDGRNQEEQDYLEKLRRVRYQNFNERRMQQGQAPGNVHGADGHLRADIEERRKKIEALRQQADQRAQHLKQNLEREAFNRKMKVIDDQKAKAGAPSQQHRANFRAAPAASITKVLKEIGAIPSSPEPPLSLEQNSNETVQPALAPQMSNALREIGAGPTSPEPQSTETNESELRQRQKEAILRKLNENPPGSPRSKWGTPAATPISGPSEAGDAPVSARSQWGEEHVTLRGLPLEQTSSQMDVTSVGDVVIDSARVAPVQDQDPPVSARRQWGGRADTVLNVLKDVHISDAIPQSPEVCSNPSSPAIGSTITVSPKHAINKGTITIQSAEDGKDQDKRFDRPPVLVKCEGAGSLFDRVQLEDDEDEDEKTTAKDNVILEDMEDTTEKKKLSSSGALVRGLTTGHFDLENAQFLRTCSEPDLTKLFKEMSGDNPFKQNETAKPSQSLEVTSGVRDEEEDELGEDEHKDGTKTVIPDELKQGDNHEPVQGQTGQPDKPDADGISSDPQHEHKDSIGEGDNEEDDDDDDDLFTVRESMRSLLVNDDEDDDEDCPKVPFVLSDDDDNDEDVEEDVENEEEEDNVKEGVNGEEMDDQEEEAREDADDPMTDPTVHTDNAHFSHGQNLSLSAFSELFPSDESDEEDDDDDYDVFSRLEESRLQLEEELGCTTFLDAYKAVQAIHEDEDEDMEKGTRIAMNILGPKREHLYPKIFQLVMADTAFTEDNS